MRPPPLRTSDQIAQRLHRLVRARSVVGASVALLRDGRLMQAAAGVQDRDTGSPVTSGTVFDAASLTKPVVAHAALQLVDAGLLALDQPLACTGRPVVPDDPRALRVTLRHLLTHTAGLQNLRGRDERLRLHFDPGSRFSYASLGFAWLQLAMETATGEPLQATVQRLVFTPLGMADSSLEWREDLAPRLAAPHEGALRLPQHRHRQAAGSYSLRTTAPDYARFVAALLSGQQLQPATWQLAMQPQVRVPRGEIVCLQAPPDATEPGIAWGLGWGLEPQAGTFFQWGKMDGVRAFMMGSPTQRSGLVLLTNSNTGLRLMHALVPEVLAGEHPALRWLADGVTE